MRILKRRYDVRQVEFAEVLLKKLDSKRVSYLTGIPSGTCKYIKKQRERKASGFKKRLPVYGPDSRIFFRIYKRNKIPVLDVILFSNLYPSDVFRNLMRWI